MNEPSTQWFSFIDDQNRFRIGGALCRHNPEYNGGEGFLKEQIRLKNKEYVLYKIPKGNILSLNIKNVGDCNCDHKDGTHTHPYAVRVFIKRELQKYNKPSRVPNKPSSFRAKHAIYLKDRNNEKQLVYYHKDQEKRERFQNTYKFKLAKKYGWEFK